MYLIFWKSINITVCRIEESWGKRKLNKSLDDVEETCPICEGEIEFDGADFTTSTCDEGHKIQRCRQTFALIDPLSADLYRCQICGHMLNSTLFRWLFRLHAPGGCPVCNCLGTRVSWPTSYMRNALLYTGELLWNFSFFHQFGKYFVIGVKFITSTVHKNIKNMKLIF